MMYVKEDNDDIRHLICLLLFQGLVLIPPFPHNYKKMHQFELMHSSDLSALKQNQTNPIWSCFTIFPDRSVMPSDFLFSGYVHSNNIYFCCKSTIIIHSFSLKVNDFFAQNVCFISLYGIFYDNPMVPSSISST